MRNAAVIPMDKPVMHLGIFSIFLVLDKVYLRRLPLLFALHEKAQLSLPPL